MSSTLSGSESTSAPVRVMHVVQALGLAGTEYGVIKLSNQMDPGRIRSSICCLVQRSVETEPLVSEMVPVHVLNKKAGLDMRIVARLSTIIRQEAIDVIHSRNWPTFLYSVLAGRLCGIPVVHSEHGRETRTAGTRRLEACRRLAKWVDRVITVNDEIACDIENHWMLRPERITMIRNGVDLDAFVHHDEPNLARKEFRWTDRELVLLNVGGFRPVKDHSTLLRAFARLLENIPNARLLIVGTDWGSGERQRMEQLASELQISRQVHFAGVRYDVPKLQTLCDVYVNSSLFEGMSNTILEAMAASKPVVASSVGGNQELVRDGETGLLFSAGDAEELARKLTFLLQRKDLRLEMGAAGRRVVETYHSMANMLEKYAETYSEVHLRAKLRRNSGAREHIKRALSRSVKWSGLNWMRRSLHPHALTILTYHRVLPLRQALDYAFQGMVMPRDVFEAQIAHVAREYDVVTLSDGVKELRQGRLNRGLLAITFDDGYCDNYDHAAPILAKYKVPATFFLATGAIDHSMRLWWDDVADAVKKLLIAGSIERAQAVVPDSIGRVLARLLHGDSSQVVSQSLVSLLNAADASQRKQVIGALLSVADLKVSERPDLMMTWEQVQEMQRAGMEFGAHTVTHAFIDELDEQSARNEISGSASRLTDKLAVPARGFAFPRGRATGLARDWLTEANIEFAVTTDRGINQVGADLLMLKRIDAGWGCLKSGFDATYFEAELGGWFEWTRRTN